MVFSSITSAFLLACVHLFAHRLCDFRLRPRSRWLSLAGGISVSYVFVHLLPELNEKQEIVAEQLGDHVTFKALENHIYLAALCGLLFFYVIEKAARARSKLSTSESNSDSAIFWLHVGAFAIYNVIVGYLLVHRLDHTALGLVLYLFSMALHFVVNDYGLMEHHEKLYENKGRLILAAAPLAGWALGMTVDVHESALALLFSFLAGGVILNVLKEEIPDERESSVLTFSFGALAYSVILVLTT